MEEKELKQAVQSLHKYFIWANRMREHFYKLVPVVANAPTQDRFSTEAIEAELYMNFWYGELHVVIEGWQELGLSDPIVDGLLDSPNLELLKRYRNGVFHFQKDYFDDRFIDFMTKGRDTASWVFDVNDAIGTYFLTRFAKERTQRSSPGV